VDGARVLCRLFAGRRLDFCVFFSSVSAILGEVGQVDYCAANAFLDATAHALRRRGVRATSIDWGPWREVGMLAAAAVPPELRAWHAEALRRGISPAEGVEAFRRALASGLAQVVVSPRDFAVEIEHSRGMTLAALERNARAEAGHERPAALRTGYAAPRNAVEELLAGLWQEILGISRVGIDDDFFELGGHSLLATQLVSRVGDALQVQLAPDTLFAHPTVAGLAGALSSTEVSPERIEAIADVHRRIDRMSPAEVEATLAARQGSVERNRGEAVLGG
jgi:acyl carrier protein